MKGVTWDPVGKFIASQSDDRSVKIWKTSDWTIQNTITEPFEECGGTTHILRLSWSPDGQYLVSAHAMNGGGPTAQIIERDGWKCDKDFVGHRKAVTCKFTLFLKRKKVNSMEINSSSFFKVFDFITQFLKDSHKRQIKLSNIAVLQLDRAIVVYRCG